MLSWLFSGILKDLKDYIRFYKNLFFSAIFFVFFWGGGGGWGWGSHGRKSLVFIQFLLKDSQNFAKNYVSDLEISGFCEIAWFVIIEPYESIYLSETSDFCKFSERSWFCCGNSKNLSLNSPDPRKNFYVLWILLI